MFFPQEFLWLSSFLCSIYISYTIGRTLTFHTTCVGDGHNDSSELTESSRLIVPRFLGKETISSHSSSSSASTAFSVDDEKILPLFRIK